MENNNNSPRYILRKLFLMSLSIVFPLILIGTPGWGLTLATIVIFAAELSNNALISYIYRMIHNIFLRPGLYICALIITITGPQDFIAIVFYIALGFQIKNIAENFVVGIIMLVSIWK